MSTWYEYFLLVALKLFKQDNVLYYISNELRSNNVAISWRDLNLTNWGCITCEHMLKLYLRAFFLKDRKYNIQFQCSQFHCS